MRMSRFYIDPEIQPLPAVGSRFRLDQRNAHYIKNVLRAKVGAEIYVFDGRGLEYRVVIQEIKRSEVAVEIVEERVVEALKNTLHTSLVIGISKGERMDWVIQKATELGVSAIFPLFTQRVDIRLNEERREKKIAHWRSVAISASEQSGRSHLPLVHSPQNLNEMLSANCANAADHLSLVLDFDRQTLREVALGIQPPSHVTVLVGPEGGLTEAEIVRACEHGFRPVSIGRRVLRTETAPLAALSIVQYLWGDLG